MSEPISESGKAFQDDQQNAAQRRAERFLGGTDEERDDLVQEVDPTPADGTPRRDRKGHVRRGRSGNVVDS